MKLSTVAIIFTACIVISNALPVPEDSAAAKSSEDTKTPSVFEDADVSESRVKTVRSIDTSTATEEPPLERISKALENLQLLRKFSTLAASEAAKTNDATAKNGVANTLTQGTKTLVETKTSLLKGLTGSVPSSLQADASSTNEAVQRNERGSAAGGYGGYPSSSYGPNSVSETPNNFINVFSQAAANTVNFGTQLLNSLVGVAANILQGTVSTLLSLLNAKGQVVGAVVQSAPPVLASVTRTAGDVLAAKARIFGAVTQSAVNFGSQLAQTLTNIFAGLFNGPNAINFNALTGGGRSGEGGAGNVLGGVGNLAQTVINAKLNLLNGLLSPFTGGRPLLNFGGSGSGGGLAALFGGLGASASSSPLSSSSAGSGYSSPSEPNFRITITATSPSPSSTTDGSN